MLTTEVLSSICLKAAGGRNHEREIYPCWPEDEPKSEISGWNLYLLEEDTAGEGNLNEKIRFVDFI